MKHLICLLIAMLSMGYANAQVAQWLVPPDYDAIEMSPDNNVIIAQQGFNHHIYNLNSKCLAKVSDDLYPFSEGYAVTTKPETAYLTAIYNEEGVKNDIKDRVQLGWGYPLFHDGFLLVNDGNYFYFMDTEGGIDPKPYYKAYPFSHGYAACFTFANIRKMKDPMYLLLDTELEPIELSWEGKPLKIDDIEFISSISDEGKGIVVYKGKIFYFDAATAELSPVLTLSGDDNIKNQARMDGDINDALVHVDDSTKMMIGKCGKARLGITFNAITLRPLKVVVGEEEKSFEKEEVSQTSYSTVLKEVKDLNTGKYSLCMGDKEILPAQFDAIEQLKGNTALVEMNEKLGLLRVNADDHFVFLINKGDDIGFRHKHFNTIIRLNMPAYINAEETSIEIDPHSGCNVDKRTREAKNNPDGSYVEYKCSLLCPHDVGDNSKDISYPAYIVYQGLRTPMMTAYGKAWHSKYLTVDVNQQEVNLTGNTLHFTVNITADRVANDEVFPFTPSLATEDLRFEMEKVSDTRYKCTVYDLKEGRNNIIVRVTEEGCPPADYTFEVTYEPRAAQKKVTVTKKSVTTPKPAQQHTAPVLRL